MLKKKQPNGQESKKKFFDENMRHGHKKPVFITFMFARWSLRDHTFKQDFRLGRK